MSRRSCFVALVVALATAGTASAADFFVVHPTVASPGDRVTVRSGATGSQTTPVRFDLYLVRSDDADHVRSSRDPRLVALGVIAIDEDGRGSLSFAVPDVGPGAYTIASRRRGPCPHSGICGPAFYSASVGDQIVPRLRSVMTLRVRGEDSRRPFGAWPTIGVLLVLLAGIAAVAVPLLRTRGRRPPRAASPTRT